MVRTVAAVTLVLLFPLLAGCFGGDETFDPFASMDAPRWEAGYSWAWTATESASWSYESEAGAGRSSGEEARRVEHRVVNTEVPFLGEPVYWLRGDEDLDGLGPMGIGAFEEDGLHAVGQDDLQPVARFHESSFLVAGCEEVSLRAYRSDSFPLLRFPLEHGSQWEEEVQEHVTKRAVVLGETEVEVPAGVFDAVVVELRVDIEPAFFESTIGPDGEEMGHKELVSFAFSARVWYAEEVRNVVRFESSMESHMVEDSGEELVLSAERRLALESFSLTADVEEAVPPVVDVMGPETVGPVMRRVPEVRIVSDTRFPLNAANGSLDVTFGLEDLSVMQDGTVAARAPPGGPGSAGVVFVEEVPATNEWYDAENQTVLWSFMSQEGAFTATGPVVQVALPPGGAFEVAVRLVPRPLETPEASGCAQAMDGAAMGVRSLPLHAYGDRLANGRFSVEWRQPFAVSHSGMDEADHPIADVPLRPGAEVVVAYHVFHQGQVRDEVSFRLEVDGRDHRLERDQPRSFDLGGNGTAVWEARSNALLGPAGVTFGHNVQGTIHVRY